MKPIIVGPVCNRVHPVATQKLARLGLPIETHSDKAGILFVMYAGYTDSDLHHWLRWASERGNTPSFVRTVAEAARMACMPDYVLLRPVLVELKRRYPEG